MRTRDSAIPVGLAVALVIAFISVLALIAAGGPGIPRYGEPAAAEGAVPGGNSAAITSGDSLQPALSADGRYVAFASAASPSGDRSLSDDPTLLSHTISAGGRHTCGVRTDGTVACWGWNDYGQATPPASTFTQVSAGDYHTCGVMTDGTLACWGWNDYGQATPPAGTFSQVSAGCYHTCGVMTDGILACWGRHVEGQAAPPAGAFTQVSAGWI
ncbi:MAG TPA: hypothetical protein VM013_08490, partial [Dehalococcoidia bacterium]|nr:hypothetical protein [Dehalococcoidia bacterium]